MVNKFIYVITVVMVIVIGGMFAGCLSEGDLQSRSDQIKGIQDNQKAILFNQDKLLNGATSHNGQINNKLDAIMEAQRKQVDLTQMLIYETRKQTQENAIPIKIEITVNRGGYGEVSSFNSIDDALTFINGLK